jgi:uncharacterized protein (TIGR03435 family)
MCVAAFGLSALLASAAGAQRPPAGFEVASVRANRSGAMLQVLPTLQPGGRVFALNLPLREFIRAAYGLQDNQLVITSPLADARFDLEARAGATATRDQAVEMLRALLAERFGLKTHGEMRQLPVYTLERVNATRLGPQIKLSGTECAPLAFPSGSGAPPPPPPPAALAGTPLGPRETWAECPSMFFPGGWSLRSMSMQAFAVALERLVRRTVIDRTGLAGVFDLDLTYVPEILEAPLPGGNVGVAAGGPVDGPSGSAPPAQRTGPSLFTALRDQLHLRLEPGRTPVDVLVIDRVQPPTDN